MALKKSTLTWDVPPSGGSDITGYRVLVVEGGDIIATLTPPEPGIDVEHAVDVERTLVIQARNALGYGAPAELLIPMAPEVVTPTPGAPTAPTITAVRDTTDPANKITIAFSNTGTGAWINHAVLVNGSVYTNPFTPPVTVSGDFTAATDIQVRSTYQDAGVNKTVLSNTVRVPAHVNPGVVPPTIEYVESGDRNIQVRITAVGSGYVATETRAYRNGVLEASEPSDILPMVGDVRYASALRPGQTYDVVIAAIYQNANNTYGSIESTPVTATAAGFLGTPPTISVVPGDAQITVDIIDEGSGYTSYILVVRDMTSTDEPQQLSMVDFPYVATGLVNGNEHLVGIIVTDEDGYQDQSNVEFVTPLDTAQLPALTAPTFAVSNQRFWSHTPTEQGGVLAFIAGYGGGISTPPDLNYGSQTFTHLGAATGQGGTSRQIFAYWLPDPAEGTQQISYDSGGNFVQAGGFSVDVLRAGNVELIDSQGSTLSTTQILGTVYGATPTDLIVWGGVARSDSPLVKWPSNALAQTGSDGSNVQAILGSLRLTGDEVVGYNLEPADAAALIVLKITAEGAAGPDEPGIG